MKDVLDFVQISKQAFHQMLKRRYIREEEQQQLLPLIHKIRKDHPRMSEREMYLLLQT